MSLDINFNWLMSKRKQQEEETKPKKSKQEIVNETNQSLLSQTGDSKYCIILADPPWHYQDNTDGLEGCVTYDTMKLSQLKELKVSEISDENCVLLMWTTGPKMMESGELLKSWGFKYITMFGVWVKTPITAPRLGNYTRQCSEFVIMGTKGRVEKLLIGGTNISNTFLEDSKEHSQKPKTIHNYIEKIFHNLPKIELFARQSTDPNWEYWGNETQKYGSLNVEQLKKRIDIRKEQKELRDKIFKLKRVKGPLVDHKNKYGTEINGQKTLKGYFKSK
jgi:N6-adenosine-specific RNA methylase IME4